MKLTLELSKTTIIFFAIFLLLGYFIGAAFPLTGLFGQALPSGQTSITIGDNGGSSGGAQTQLTVGNSPTIGNADAEIQFYEFSDFQCPFCRRFYTQSLPQLLDEYVSTGKVLFVYKDFPLESIHPAAFASAVYARCANEQGKWEEYHNKIFDEQNKFGTGTIAYDENDLLRWAAEVGLDVQELGACVSSGKYNSTVQEDFQLGLAAGVSGTPTFFIGNSEKGFVQIVGAQPYSVLKQAIDQQLS